MGKPVLENSIEKEENSLMVKVGVIVYKDGKLYTAIAPALQVSSYGDSKKDCVEAFKEALEIFFEDFNDEDNLVLELLRLGWKIQTTPKPNFQPPKLKISDWPKASAPSVVNVKERINLKIQA